MAFDLQVNNLSGVSVIDQPAGVLATQDNFIDLYSYAEKECPELIPQLHMANGLGKITKLMTILGTESTYEADQIQHAEQGRLHNILKEVSVTGTTFTSPTDHNLRVNETIKISDGVTEAQATVQSITSDTVFVATNDAGVAFNFVGEVDIIADFSNSWAKGQETFTRGKNWEPNVIVNHSHIIKEVYETSNSNLIEKIWIETANGPRWVNFEIERTGSMFDNKVELTQMFHERKASGNNRGQIGVVPQIENRGNIANEYLTDIEDLSEIARRAKQQGTCRSFTVWADHQQMAFFRQMSASVNAYYAEGTNYGMFQNSKDMALMLDFKSIYIDGVTFHFTPWAMLEDPTLMGNEKFLNTNLGCLIVPAGNMYATENGNSVSKPYLSCRFRGDANYNRKREIKIFGPGGTQQSKDSQTTEFLSECTNQVVGANNFFVVRRGIFY